MKKLPWIVATLSVVLVGTSAIVVGRADKPTPNPAVGLVTAASEQAITIKSTQGEDITFKNEAGNISVDHLKEHMADKEPISVTWHTEGQTKVANSVDDVQN